MDAVAVDRRSWTPTAVRAHQSTKSPDTAAGTDHAQAYVTGDFEDAEQRAASTTSTAVTPKAPASYTTVTSQLILAGGGFTTRVIALSTR